MWCSNFIYWMISMIEHHCFKSNIKDVILTADGSQLQCSTLSFVYACLYPSLHTSLVVSTCLILCLLDCLGLHVFDFVNWCIWCLFLAARLSAGMWIVWISPACCFWGCCKFVQRFGARLSVLSVTLCLAVIWDCLSVFLSWLLWDAACCWATSCLLSSSWPRDHHWHHKVVYGVGTKVS